MVAADPISVFGASSAVTFAAAFAVGLVMVTAFGSVLFVLFFDIGLAVASASVVPPALVVGFAFVFDSGVLFVLL